MKSKSEFDENKKKIAFTYRGIYSNSIRCDVMRCNEWMNCTRMSKHISLEYFGFPQNHCVNVCFSFFNRFCYWCCCCSSYNEQISHSFIFSPAIGVRQISIFYTHFISFLFFYFTNDDTHLSVSFATLCLFLHFSLFLFLLFLSRRRNIIAITALYSCNRLSCSRFQYSKTIFYLLCSIEWIISRHSFHFQEASEIFSSNFRVWWIRVWRI